MSFERLTPSTSSLPADSRKKIDELDGEYYLPCSEKYRKKFAKIFQLAVSKWEYSPDKRNEMARVQLNDGWTIRPSPIKWRTNYVLRENQTTRLEFISFLKDGNLEIKCWAPEKDKVKEIDKAFQAIDSGESQLKKFQQECDQHARHISRSHTSLSHSLSNIKEKFPDRIQEAEEYRTKTLETCKSDMKV